MRRRAVSAIPLLLALGGCAAFPNASPRYRHENSGPESASNASSHSNTNNQAGESYIVFGHRYHVLASAMGYDQRGIASWYGPNFHGRLTSSGAPYNMYKLTAASKVLPLETWVKVTNLENGRSVVVQVNDRGPFVSNRIIDLSYAAAKKIHMIGHGTALVDVRSIAPPSTHQPADLAKISARHQIKPLRHHPALFVQLGAFSEKGNAERLKVRLILRQLGPIKIDPLKDHGETLFRVMIGPLKSVNKVDALTARLDQLGYHDTEVIVQ